jgi:predicted DNA binding protein
MKYTQAVAEPDLEDISEFFSLILDSSSVNEARLQYTNDISSTDEPAALYEIDGDIEEFREGVSGLPGVSKFTLAPITDGRFNLLVVEDTTEFNMMEEAINAVQRRGVITVTPVVYRNGKMYARIVGSASDLQETIDHLPSEMNLEIVRVGDFNQSRDTPISSLSDRQQEALLTAFDIGYYSRPREATHEEVAEIMGCERHTASEHLQKAESKVLSEVLWPEFEGCG